jgi:selenocysteine lyase/cysteine desulfurase
MPVRKIADAAHQKGIEVVVDGAHSFAHFEFTIPELGADYFGTSLHKWLSACIGSGFLYVKKEKIKNLYPLFAAPDAREDDIRKFEHLGTRPFFIEQAISKAIEFHEMIGQQRKQQRLFYLKKYWMEKLKSIPGVEFGTSQKPGFGYGIGLVNFPGHKLADMEIFLWNNYRVLTSTIEFENIRGLRITPNVYTTTKQLDVFIEGVNDFINKAGSK